jgi:hypothetical protein
MRHPPPRQDPGGRRPGQLTADLPIAPAAKGKDVLVAADPRLRIELAGKLLHAKVIEQRP